MRVQLRKFIMLALAVVLAPTTAFADDTEIFYAAASADNNENRPAANVMVMLDTSGSMRWCEANLGDGNTWCSDADKRRINMLEDAMHLLIDSVPADVSMGLGRFNYSSSDGGHILLPVVPVDEEVRRVFKETVSSLNSAGDSSSGSGDPYGGTPTAMTYWELARYMLGYSPESASYGNSSSDNNTKTVCLNYEENTTCEDVDIYSWVNISGSCNTSSPYCRRQCVRWRWTWGGYTCREYSYQQYQWVGVDQQCQTTSVCTREETIVDSDGNYLSPRNTSNQCESNHIVLFTDGSPSGRTLPSFCGSGSYDCQRLISSWLSNTHDVNTYNIGLYMDSNRANMESVSTDGADGTYTASNAEDLASAFLEIFDLIDRQSRSLSTPGVAINQMNRFQHLDQLYYSVFEPTDNSYWEGNLKRYKLDDGVIEGQNGDAINPDTGYFKESSRSFWSADVDGYDAKLGGARDELTGDRKLYFSTAGGGTSKVDWTTVGKAGGIQKTDVGLTDSHPDEELERLTDMLKTQWGDPLHSVPVMVNYGGSSDNNYVFVSNNGGMLHAIDTRDGSEKFAFMPYDTFSRANEFTIERKGLQDGNRRQTYGLDGSWVVWRKPGDKVDSAPKAVYLYGGMRRGGQNYYALDVTSLNAPKMKWQIKGGSGDFDKLGQTWSTPTLTQILVGQTPTPVLIFGGGYDPDGHDLQQGKGRSAGDSMGNAVYIVNAESGKLIWSASNSGATTTHSAMKWSVPSGISVVDKEQDGIADYLYFGDLGGQVFRVDIAQSGKMSDTEVHRLGSLAGSGASNNRRFYEPPAVVYSNDDGVKTLYVALASGYRSHPLDENTQDGVFVLKDTTAMSGGGAPKDWTLSDLDEASESNTTVSDSGWYYWFEKAEKSMSAPVVFNNVMRFSTYSPISDDQDPNPCAVSYGASYLHTANILTGGTVTDSSGDVTTERREELEQSTPPPSPVLVTDGSGNVDIIVGTEVVGDQELGFDHLRKRRWYQLEKTQANEFKMPAGANP